MATGLWLRGTEGARPAFGVPSRIYFAYDTGRLFSDTGTAWDPTGLAPQGAYSAGTTYQKNDLVTNGGQTWRAKQTVTGVTPVAGASWELWAAQGSTGTTGNTGPAGVDAYTTTTSNFNQPAAAANVTINVGSSAWMFVGQYLYVAGGGYYTVTSKPSGTSVQINNINASGNASSGTTISSGAGVSPGGPQGIQGIQGPAGTGYTIQENGSALATQRSNLNFGTGVTAADNAGSTRTDISVDYGTTAGTATQGNDSRNSDARTPTAHASTHAVGGSDPVTRFGEMPFYASAGLTVKTGVGRYPAFVSGTIVAIRAMVNTAPTGQSVIFDVRKNGTSIYTTTGNRPTIAAGGNSTNATLPDTLTFVAGDYITVDVVQIGSTIPGSDAVVVVRYSY